jgi:two-component system sensor histidine kinase/response regulator
VVLMDMEMPEMDGIAATRAIRRLDERIRHIPIVALTANAFSEDQQRCREAGMTWPCRLVCAPDGADRSAAP